MRPLSQHNIGRNPLSEKTTKNKKKTYEKLLSPPKPQTHTHTQFFFDNMQYEAIKRIYYSPIPIKPKKSEKSRK